MKITKKFILIFVLVLIFPTLAIHQGVVRYAKHVVETSILNQNERMTELIVNRLNSQINDVILQLRLVAGGAEGKGLQQDVLYERAKQVIANSTLIYSIYYVDTAERIVFEAPFHPQQLKTYHYAKFEHVKWSYTYVVTGLVDNPSGKRVITVAIPVFYADREFQGVLIAELSANFLSNLLQSSVDQGGFSYLVDGEGQVIASTEEAEMGENYSQEPIVERLLLGDSGSIQANNRGVPSVMTYQTMQENWGLALGVPEQVAFRSVRTLSGALTYSYIGFFALIICLIIFGTRQLLLPLLRLSQFARRFEGDSALKPLPISLTQQHDEIGDLARNFNDMAVRIERNHRFMRDIIEGIPYALITLDAHGVVLRVNSRWIELIGRSVSHWEGKRLAELPELSFLSLELKQAEVAWTDRKGDIRYLRMVTAPLHDGVLAIVQDISQLKMWEAHAGQSEKLALIGQINTGIAHELRNPLAVLASSAELLREELRSDPGSEWVPTLSEDIVAEIARMSQIVNELLSFARTKQEEFIRIELVPLVERVLHLARVKLGERRIVVEREYGSHVPIIIGKPNKLVQVFLNLLLNSMDAMAMGGVITIRILSSETEAKVEICDQGNGITEEQLKWLFNPFFTTKEEGHGLGLTIARDIMIEHGGALEVERREGSGTLARCRFAVETGRVNDVDTRCTDR